MTKRGTHQTRGKGKPRVTQKGLKAKSRSVSKSFGQKLTKRLAKLPRIVVIMVGFAIVGTVALVISQAATPTSSTEAEGGTRSSGANIVANGNASGGAYIRFGPGTPTNNLTRRFFADSVSWNKPVSQMGISSSYPGYVERMFKYSGASGWDDPVLGIGFNPSVRGNYNLALRDYSVPIYDLATMTPAEKSNLTTKRVYWSGWAYPNAERYECDGVGISPCTGSQTSVPVTPGMFIPWDPDWKPGTGYDRIMAVINSNTGEFWSYYGTNIDPLQCTIFGGGENWLGNATATPAFDANDPNHICMSGANRRANIYEINQPTTVNGRGMGIDKLALVVRAEEVQSGEIRHALGLTIFSQMFGPACNPATPAVAAGAGVSCAFYLPPATRIEHTTIPHGGANACKENTIQNTHANRSKTIPSGMRFRVNRPKTIADGANSIEAWLNSKGYTGNKRNTARIIGTALVDYGFVAASETGCGNPHWEFDGMQNPKTRDIWVNELGLEDTGSDNGGQSSGQPDGLADYPSGNLMHGFITETNMQIVNPG
ncbi:hypothetical protein EKI60_01005 [Candidatus Saccharibacteria bacterium]|nr:MAG: hypothetical protein EKI60_01005 [Candidatus Saccharibacteria bacterium]